MQTNNIDLPTIINDTHTVQLHINGEVLSEELQHEIEPLKVPKVVSQCKESTVGCDVQTPMDQGTGESPMEIVHTGEKYINAKHTGKSHIDAIHTSESPINAIHTIESPMIHTSEPINAIHTIESPMIHTSVSPSNGHKSSKVPRRKRRPVRTENLINSKVAKKSQKSVDKNTYKFLKSEPIHSHPVELIADVSAALSSAKSYKEPMGEPRKCTDSIDIAILDAR